MKFRINEIFQSIQGEGLLVGVAMNFIRFTKCNLECKWCDTDFREGKEMVVGEILGKLNSNFEWVSLTGGEPLMEKNLSSLIGKLKEKKYTIFLETNGTIFKEKIFKECDFVSIDLKPPSSGNSSFDEKIFDYALKNQKKTQLKVIIKNEEDVEFFREIYKEEYRNWVLQPEWEARGKMRYGEVVKKFPRVRIIPQIHKILNLR